MRNRVHWTHVAVRAVMLVIALSVAFNVSHDFVNARSADASAAEPIRIGVLAAVSGPHAASGEDVYGAVELAIADINADVLGRPIELVWADDGCTPEMGAEAAHRLADAGVIAVVGGTCSATAAAVSDVLWERGGIPYVNGWSVSPELTEQGYDHFFRTIGRNDQQGPFAARVLTEVLGARRIAFLHDGTDYARGLALAAFASAVGAGNADVVYFGAIDPGKPTHRETLERVALMEPDAVYFTGYSPDGATLLLDRRELGIEFPIVLGSGNALSTLLQQAGQAASGVFLTTPPLPEAFPGTARFTAAYRAMFGREPGPPSTFIYDAVGVLVEALRRAADHDGDLTHENVKTALRSIDRYDGLTGSFRFDASGDRSNAPWALTQVRDGAFVPYMWPADDESWRMIDPR